MASLRIRRAVGAAAALTLLVSATAIADTIVSDGDSVTPGTQTSVHLGSVEAGDARSVDVAFVLTCMNGSHVAPGSTLQVVKSSLIVPDDGSATVSPATIDVPADWPASGATCPTGIAPVSSSTPAHVVVRAPSTAGPGREFDVLFAPSPNTGSITGMIAFSIFMDVVEPAPADTTPPVLHGVPDSMTVTTSGTSAAVSWTKPTATDDTDPSPSVGCSPKSGSTFGLGTTTVTCTATDSSGNSASASFDVTVVREPSTELEGAWGQPLGDGLPALVGHAGRTLPLKLTVTADAVAQGPNEIAAPVLRVAPLDGCSAGATPGAGRSAGTLGWSNGTWQLNLRTDELGAGCWRLEASVDGTTVASAVIRLEDGQVAAALHKR
jgi:HYR domain